VIDCHEPAQLWCCARTHPWCDGVAFCDCKSLGGAHFWGSSMRFLNLIMALVLAHGCLWSADQARAVSLDFAEQSAKTKASRIEANPRAIFPDPRRRPLSNAELISRQLAEAIKPAEISQPTEVAKPAEAAQPAEPVKLVETAHPTEAVNSAETSPPTEATKPVETTSPAEALKPMEASPPLEVAKPLEMARPVEADLPSATIHAKVEETKWIVSATTSPVDYSPLVSAIIRPRQQVNSGLSGLTISCRLKRTELSLRLMGDVDVPRFGEIRIDTQIDDQRSVKQRWIWDEQGKILIYEDDPVALLQSIPDEARLRLGVGDSKGARHIATYQLVGLDAVRKKIASACAWPPFSAQASAEKR
jgi:hypothetical protein